MEIDLRAAKQVNEVSLEGEIRGILEWMVKRKRDCSSVRKFRIEKDRRRLDENTCYCTKENRNG